MYNCPGLTPVVPVATMALLCAINGLVCAQPAQDGTAVARRQTEEATAPIAEGTPSTAGTTPTSDASKPEAAPRPTPIKWRPLVVRSEIPPDQRPVFGTFKGTYVMVGPHVGMGLTAASLLLGGEVSVVHQTTEFAWFGGYVDAVHDFGREQTRFSIGPELGWSAVGLDAGYLLSSTPVGLAHGITLRPLVSLGYATLFGRFTKDLTSGARVWAELGVLLKYPIQL